MRAYERDLNGAVWSYVEQGGKVGEFPLRGFCKYWWVGTQQAEQIAKEGRLGGGIFLYGRNMLVCYANVNSRGMKVEQEGSGEGGKDKEDVREL